MSPEITDAWNAYYNELEELKDVKIPRWLGIFPGAPVQLHTFCDASQKAYGAVIYVRTQIDDNKFDIRLLTSKSRVADLQSVTIPRMELTAAKLGAKLTTQVAATLEAEGLELYFWTDSTIVLHWLRKIPSDLKVFVGNRVSEIQSLTRRRSWRHVESKQNPADLISRSETVEG